MNLQWNPDIWNNTIDEWKILSLVGTLDIPSYENIINASGLIESMAYACLDNLVQAGKLGMSCKYIDNKWIPLFYITDSSFEMTVKLVDTLKIDT